MQASEQMIWKIPQVMEQAHAKTKSWTSQIRDNLSGERCMAQQARIHRKHVGTILVSET